MARVCEYICDELSDGMAARGTEEQWTGIFAKVSEFVYGRPLPPDVIYRCVNEGTAFVKDERAKIRVSFPSYKLVYEGGCEDLIWGTGKSDYRAEKRDQERRRSRWLFI